jgi:hypothetical protein
MPRYMFIGGSKDGLGVLAPEDMETIHVPVLTAEDRRQLPVVVTVVETYIRETLSLGDVSVTIYRHESLTPEEVLDRLLHRYNTWAVSRNCNDQ